MKSKLYNDDSLTVMESMDESSIDAVITDPPYGIGFDQGSGWDESVPSSAYWEEVHRVLKPGGHLMAFGSSRTGHRLVTAIEDAGMDIRDTMIWLFSGMPKNFDISKAIDKRNVSVPNVVGTKITEESRTWSGYGTSLKPCHEIISLSRKKFSGSLVQNVLKYGTGALNINGSKIGDDKITINTWDDGAKPFGGGAGHKYTSKSSQGRWPGNILMDEEVSGILESSNPGKSKFYYHSKVRSKEKNIGVDKENNKHPTVKPVDLIRYLINMLRPPSGIQFTVLDPFMGSGSHGVACALEGVDFIGIEKSQEFFEISSERIAHHEK